MGSTQNCEICYRNQKLIIPLTFLLIISSFTNARFMVQGRSFSKLAESASHTDYSLMGREEVAAVATARRLIGSRPPRCERRCSSCGHCEAIQVPIVPVIKSHGSTADHDHHLSATPTVASSRGDYISNYKPICWKCKCGDFIFDPIVL
ncbi:EPIDERMAL PATTERNING FACTOR-like protein 2 [Actinidia eriantha]|uniref:EPIDERMAL PATTERNING FACTOR-like protein 2 n=1 Tax=Actinidia eriantha TaxID=165200 RepID=UPI00258AE943|nr:EPIDERMAL PATTERNING FACTOR-like protein 2 [Actinidia eriantha]